MVSYASRPATDLQHAWRWPLAALLLGLLLSCLAVQAVHQQREAAAQAEFLRLTERVAAEASRRFTLPVSALKSAHGRMPTAEERLQGVAEVAGQHLDVAFFDGHEARPANLVHAEGEGSLPGARRPLQAAPEPAHRFSATRELLLGDRVFTLRTATRSAFDGFHDHQATAIVALAGLGLSLLVAWGVWQQATARARVETRVRALTAELQGLARIAEHTTNAVVMTDAQGRIRWINEGFTRTSGYTPQHATGRTLGELVGSGLTDPAVIAKLEAGLRDGTPVSAEVVNRARDGHLYWMQVDVQPTFDDAGALCGFMEIGTDITAFKLAEQDLQRSRDEAAALAAELETMALVARHTTNAVVVTDAQRRVRWVNEGFTRITGYTFAELAGRSPGALLQCERTDRAVVDAMRAALNAGRSFQGELVNRNKAGQDYWIEIHITPLHGDDGLLSGFVAIESDIGDRKAAEATLAQERNWLAHVVAGADAGEGEFNVRTLEIRWSPRFAALLGYTVEEVIPLAPRWGSPLHHPDDRAGAVQAMRAYLKGETAHLVAEYRLRHREGHWVWIQTRGSASAWNADGGVEWLSGMNIDVTERHRTTDQLRESLALVDALFEALPIPVVLKDTQFRYQRMNKAYADLFDTDATQLLGKTAWDVIDAQAAKRHFEEDQKILETNGTVGYEVHQVLANGRRLDALVSKTALRAPGGQVLGLIGTAVDISQRMAAERGMAEARAAAEAANSAKSAFLATMSHEIRTPMNGVIGMAELLTHSPLNEEQAQAVRTIIASGQALLGLIDDILDFSKIEAGRMDLDSAEFALTPLVEGVCATLLPLAVGRDVRLCAWIDADVPEQVVGDALRVRQLLNNLVGNAIKFSARNDGRPGRVAVRVRLDGEGGGLRFAVSDNGIGMDEATIARLFTPFTQAEVSTTRRFGGTGLGLAICRRLVDLMGGRIGVHSEPGAGSSFHFTLPLPAGAQPATAEAPLLAGLHCLLVPGQDLPAPQLRQWLQRAGAEVQEADSLGAALQQAAARGGDGGGASLVVHPDTQGALALPAWAAAADLGLRQLVVGHGRRETVRIVTPSVWGIDLLRREPFINAVAMVAGRLALPPRASLQAQTLTSGRTPPTVEEALAAGQLILVAEDDATNRAVLQRQLAVLGHAAEFTHDGEQALARWRAGRHALLLADLHMPQMDGYVLCTTIRLEEIASGRARMPIVALTANALKGEVVRAREAGMDDYLTKPVPLAQLQAALQAWMPVPAAALAPATSAATSAMTSAIPSAPMSAATAPAAAALAVLDLQVLRALIGGDEAGLRELLADFTVSAQQHAADLRAALQARDAGAASAVAHKLKSASRSVGALALGEACAALEAAGLVGEAALSPGLRESFESALQAVLHSAQSLPETTLT